MTSLKLHYDGWLALPANIRRQLGLATGDDLYAEIVEGGIMLRVDGKPSSEEAEEPESEPVSAKPMRSKAKVAAMADPEPAPAKPAAPQPATTKKVSAKPTPEPEPMPAPAPRKKAKTAPEPEPAAAKLPVTGVLKARGRRKANGTVDTSTVRN